MALRLLLLALVQQGHADLEGGLGVAGRRGTLVPDQCRTVLVAPGVQDAEVERRVDAARLGRLGEPGLGAGRVARLEQEHGQCVGGLAVARVRGAAVPLLGLRRTVLGRAEQAEVVGTVDVARVHRGAVPALGGLLFATGRVQGAQGVGGVPVAVLGRAKPPHGGALLVARVTQQEAERAGCARLARLRGDEVPAAGLLGLAALFEDGAEVQSGTPVAARGGLPVPLLGLAHPSRRRTRDRAVVPACHGRPVAPGRSPAPGPRPGRPKASCGSSAALRSSMRARRYAASRCPCSAAARSQRSAPTSLRCSSRSARAYAPSA